MLVEGPQPPIEVAGSGLEGLVHVGSPDDNLGAGRGITDELGEGRWFAQGLAECMSHEWEYVVSIQGHRPAADVDGRQ